MASVTVIVIIGNTIKKANTAGTAITEWLSLQVRAWYNTQTVHAVPAIYTALLIRRCISIF